jgi:uncharacterized protein DUF6232
MALAVERARPRRVGSSHSRYLQIALVLHPCDLRDASGTAPPTLTATQRPAHTRSGTAMTTFYDHDFVRITERWLSVGSESYRIGQLHNLRRGRGPADHTTRQAGVLAAISAIMTVAVGPYIPLYATASVFAVLVALPAAVATVRARLFPRPHQLWADYHGSPIQLYQSWDPVEFGKISRALVRATTLAAG